MVLDGVSIDDRVVRDIAAVVAKPLAQKLEQALFFRAEVVALTRVEKEAILAALDRMPWEYEELRELLLAGPRSGASHAGIEETGVALEVVAVGSGTPPASQPSTSKPWHIVSEPLALTQPDVGPVDHFDACPHVAAQVEDRKAGVERPRCERVPHVIDPPRRDSRGFERRLPLSAAEVL